MEAVSSKNLYYIERRHIEDSTFHTHLRSYKQDIICFLMLANDPKRICVTIQTYRYHYRSYINTHCNGCSRVVTRATVCSNYFKQKYSICHVRAISPRQPILCGIDTANGGHNFCPSICWTKLKMVEIYPYFFQRRGIQIRHKTYKYLFFTQYIMNEIVEKHYFDNGCSH
jgi:hypothetical protein